MKYQEYLSKFKKIYNEYKDFDDIKIPLCAAENYVSNFSKQSLGSILEGKYITGNLNYNEDKDFIGSHLLKKFLNFSNELGEILFNSKYTDLRCMSGMNTVAIILMSLIDKSDKILITDPSSGGHGSLPKLCDNLGITYDSIPYDYHKMDIDYEKLNHRLSNDNDIKYLFFCQSDLINIPNLNKIHINDNIKIIYDATQTLGLIASKTIYNPLDFSDNVILIGGTHKTFPGTTCGFIATNNNKIIEKIDEQISPNFLRNTQINNIASVCLTMLELLKFGKEYSISIINTANKLGKLLEENNIIVKKTQKGTYSETHQIFICIPEEKIDLLYKKFRNNYITINKRNTNYIKGFRIGVQEIARYELINHLEELAKLIAGIVNNTLTDDEITHLVLYLSKFKHDNYSINDLFME